MIIPFFSSFTRLQVVVSVVRDGLRPPISDSHATSPYADLMRQCWNEEPKNRPSFDEICVRLEEILTELASNEYARLSSCSSLFLSALTNCTLPSLQPQL
jgi:hypothetical protein